MSLNAADLYSVKGLVALVTGGGSGLGLTMTQALIANGAAKVYIASRRLDNLKAAAASISPNVIPIQCDVTNKEDLERAAQKVKDDAGFLNLVVCNSGAAGPGGNMFDKKDQTAEEFAEGEMCIEYDDYLKTFSINTTSVWFTAMAFLPLLNAGNKKGNVSQTSQVIVISSTSGLTKLGGAGWAYGQSKAASIHLTKQLSTLLPRWKMRANCITPGFFPSELSAPILDNWKQEDGTYRSVSPKFIPLARLGNDQDIAGNIIYLASRAGSYVNGTVLVPDGGVTSQIPSVL